MSLFLQRWLQQSTRTGIDLLFMNLLSCERLACTELVYAWPLCPPVGFSVCCCLVCLFLFVFLFCLSVWFLSGLARRHPFLSYLMFVSFICFHRIAWSRRVPDTERCVGAKKKEIGVVDRRAQSNLHRALCAARLEQSKCAKHLRSATCAEQLARRARAQAAVACMCMHACARLHFSVGLCVCACVCVCVCVCASCGSVRACKLCSFFSGKWVWVQGQVLMANTVQLVVYVCYFNVVPRKSDFGLPLRRERGIAASSPSRASKHSRAQCGCRSQGDRKKRRATGLRRLTRFCRPTWRVSSRATDCRVFAAEGSWN